MVSLSQPWNIFRVSLFHRYLRVSNLKTLRYVGRMTHYMKKRVVKAQMDGGLSICLLCILESSMEA